MTPNRRVLPTALSFGLWLVTTSVAGGQTLAPPAERPPQGLFSRAAGGNQKLDVSVSALGAYDDNILDGEHGGEADPRTQKSGSYEALQTNLRYAKRFRHVALGLA